jgi:hypothetical protein
MAFVQRKLQMNKKVYLTMVLATVLSLAAAAPSRAAVFFFNPFGNGFGAGLISDTASFDWQVGNALAINSTPAVQAFIANGTQTEFQTVAQAQLLGILGTGGIRTPAGLGSSLEFTIVLSIPEIVTDVSTTLGAVTPNQTTFNLGPGAAGIPNFIEIYAQQGSADASDLQGTGFNNGTLILSGTVTAANSDFEITGPDLNGATEGDNFTPQLFDQFGNDDYSGQQSVVGDGTTNLQASVSFADPSYFPGIDLASLNITLFNTSQIDPFNQVDPSMRFALSAGGAAPTPRGASTGSVGTVNGNPNGGGNPLDFQFQADGNQTFNLKQNPVPEPSTLALALLGLGGLGAGGFMRRRRLAAKA